LGYFLKAPVIEFIIMKKLIFSFLLLILSLQIITFAQEVGIYNDPEVAWSGKVTQINVSSLEGIAKVEALFLGKRFECYKNGSGFKGIVGIPINQKPGFYNLKLIVTQTNGEKFEEVKSLKIWSTKFPFTKFWLKPARNKLRAQDLINEEWAQIERVLVIEDPKQLWSGKFSLPCEGPISQGFGHRQIINGKRSGNHRGMDIAVVSGTEVKAPNYGKVVFAKKLKAFGGTMVVDHGQGIHTLYFHLSKFLAQVGQNVSKGEPIALSGNSGISSGAHLHWGMSVHNLRVDPMQWVKNEI
jgi:murein DD-endopeptidase MepM/ murein hydrolase activator NlpD